MCQGVGSRGRQAGWTMSLEFDRHIRVGWAMCIYIYTNRQIGRSIDIGSGYIGMVLIS